MRQSDAFDGAFRVGFNKSVLARVGLLLCLGVIAFTFFTVRLTYPLYFAVIYICLIVSLLLQFRFYGSVYKPRFKEIALSWGLMMAVIAAELGLVICGGNGSTLRYAAFVQLSIKCIGIIAAVVCLLALAEKKYLTADRVIVSNLSLAVLASSVCILSMLYSIDLDREAQRLWAKYALIEAGIIVIGTLSAAIPLFQIKHKSKKQKASQSFDARKASRRNIFKSVNSEDMCLGIYTLRPDSVRAQRVRGKGRKLNQSPCKAQRSGFAWERRSSAMSEPSASAGGEGYGACDDAVAGGHTFKNKSVCGKPAKQAFRTGF